MKSFGFFLIFLVAAVWAAGEDVQLGPRDGLDLPAADLERIQVGTVAPDFTLESKDANPITLSKFRGGKNVVLVFYRGYW